MFESLKSWLENLDQDSHLFNHLDEKAIHIALASVLYHIIGADSQESGKEKHLFEAIMKNEFELSHDQVASLYSYVKTLKSDLTKDLKTVKEYLKDNPQNRMALMSKLNQMIALDGMQTDELKIFHDAMKVFFPELVDSETEF